MKTKNKSKRSKIRVPMLTPSEHTHHAQGAGIGRESYEQCHDQRTIGPTTTISAGAHRSGCPSLQDITRSCKTSHHCFHRTPHGSAEPIPSCWGWTATGKLQTGTRFETEDRKIYLSVFTPPLVPFVMGRYHSPRLFGMLLPRTSAQQPTYRLPTTKTRPKQ